MGDAFGNALGGSIVEQMQSFQRDELIRQIHEGTDARSRLAQAVLKSDVRPEEAVKIAGAMAERFGEEGLAPLINAGAGSGKSDSPAWNPNSDAQRSAFENVKAQLLQAGRTLAEAADTASSVAMLVAIKERVDRLRSDVDAIRENSPSLARQIESFGPAFDRALIAKDVHFNRSIQELLPAGVNRIEGDAALAQYGLTAGALNDNDRSGYFAALYRRVDAFGNEHLFYANRGTEVNTVGAVVKDGTANLDQGRGKQTAQYEQAINNARILLRHGVDVEYIGHSLGGGLAIAQALATDSKATVFNAAAVHLKTISRWGKDFSRANVLITAYNLNGDALNVTQDGGKLLLADEARQDMPLMGRALFGGPIGSAVGYAAAQWTAEELANMPAVQGNRYSFPASEAPIQVRGTFVYGKTYTSEQTYTMPAMYQQHLMDTMIYSMASRLDMQKWGK